MTTPAQTTAAAQAPAPGPHVGRHWIDDWRPEDPQFWETTGKPIARRNLIFSIFAEHVGCGVWMLWSIVVVQMTAVGVPGHPVHPAASGWALTASQALCLVAVPSGVGAFLRLPYTVAVPVFGGRDWTTVSAMLWLIPCLLLAWAVGHPHMSFAVLVAVAATAGLGGGNFASSMANISFFYPEKDKGWGVGRHAAGGNLAEACAKGRADVKPVWQALRHPDTWVMSLLYIGTFGSFIGYSAAFPTLLKTVFGRGDIALSWAFIGAAIGSLIRPVGGRLADRIGGARITAACFVMLAAGASAALWAVRTVDLTLFFVSFMFLFVATGIGHGSAYPGN